MYFNDMFQPENGFDSMRVHVSKERLDSLLGRIETYKKEFAEILKENPNEGKIKVTELKTALFQIDKLEDDLRRLISTHVTSYDYTTGTTKYFGE